MHYVVFDLEWNSAGRANKVDRAVKEAIPYEIIEIGAVKLDERFQSIDRFHTQIKPQIYPILIGPVASVTRKHQQSMRYGLHFCDAAKNFFEFCGDDYLFCTWSESDPAVLRMNLRFYQMEEHLDTWCLDVQYLFDRLIEQKATQRSIEYALDYLQISHDLPFHRAVQDADYTGRILNEIVSIYEREQSRNDLISRFAYDPNLNRSSQFYLHHLPSFSAIPQELLQHGLCCPACNAPLRQEKPWSFRKNTVVASFFCSEHGQIRVKCHVRKQQDLFSAVVSIRIEREQD